MDSATALTSDGAAPAEGPNSIERNSFSKRLQQALQHASYPADSPTRLAREFNVRFAGSPISVHAARKWIVGEAMPTQEKLRTLAAWLGVSAEWLRFGTGGAEPELTVLNSRLHSKDLAIIADLQQLDDKHRHIVHTLIRMLIHAQHEQKKLESGKL